MVTPCSVSIVAYLTHYHSSHLPRSSVVLTFRLRSAHSLAECFLVDDRRGSYQTPTIPEFRNAIICIVRPWSIGASQYHNSFLSHRVNSLLYKATQVPRDLIFFFSFLHLCKDVSVYTYKDFCRPPKLAQLPPATQVRGQSFVLRTAPKVSSYGRLASHEILGAPHRGLHPDQLSWVFHRQVPPFPYHPLLMSSTSVW